MNLLKKVSLVLALCVLTTGVALSQAQSVVISGTDGSGSGSVTIGIDPAATGGIDAALGEYNLPPLPPGFDLRCVSMPRWDTLGTDGTRSNFHKMFNLSQTDTFKFAFKPEDGTNPPVTISWPVSMGTVYGGFWRLLDKNGVELCDMTTQTNYVFTTVDDAQVNFMIVKGDGKAFHTATWMDLANAVDSKLKGGKAEKRKNLRSEGQFTFPNSADSIKYLFVEFSQAVTITGLTPFDKSDNPDGKKKKWYFSYTRSDTVLRSVGVHLFAEGDKGKELIAKAYWFIPASAPIKEKYKPASKLTTTPDAGTSRLQLNMPNWTNVGEELFAGGAFPEPNGLLLGKTTAYGQVKGKDVFRYVIMPKKYGAVYATLNAKGTTHATGTPDCFATFATKAVTKAMKGYSPAKQKNELVAALTALKFNMASSQYGHTSTGFGALVYGAQAGDPVLVDGQTVAQIATLADGYLTDCAATPAVTGAEFVTIINRINAAFSGAFDTTSFGVKTVVAPAKTIMEVGGMLVRTSYGEVEPIITPRYVESTPVEFRLNQNYPNPFNPSTTISFDLSADAFVTLKVYNTLGQEVATLIDHEEYTEGSNDVQFDASALSSGVYYYRLIVNDGEMQQVQKMMLLK